MSGKKIVNNLLCFFSCGCKEREVHANPNRDYHNFYLYRDLIKLHITQTTFLPRQQTNKEREQENQWS